MDQTSRNSPPLVFHGYEELQPSKKCCDDNFYFPVTAERNATFSKTKNGRITVAITIPCYNEEAESLRRTLMHLSEQDLPMGVHLETVIVMDGATQISESMNLFLEELFHIDPKLDPFFCRFDENINTVIIEPTFTYNLSCKEEATSSGIHIKNGSDEPNFLQFLDTQHGGENDPCRISYPSLNLSLVVKRKNQRKVNSQMWALAAHAKACNCDFAFMTDCGTGFDKDCLYFLLKPMLEDRSIGVTSGYQRGMSAEMQGCGTHEWWHNPVNFILRQGQIFDHELAYSSSKGLHNRLGFLPVVPGPCGLYRYECLGSLHSGVMREYFELTTRKLETSDLILGNTQLAEDRFPPILMTLQTTTQCKNKEGTIASCPRAHFVADSIYYFEAEIPLESLVKQRRRWNNGAFFSAIWFLSSDWLWKSNHSTFFKLVVLFASGCESIAVSIFFAIFMPPTVACSLYGATSGYLGGDVTVAFENNQHLQHHHHEEPEQVASSLDVGFTLMALIPSFLYMLAYTVFIVGHIPRAVPVKSAVEEERTKSPATAATTQQQWRADRRSSFRPALWRLAIATNVLTSLCVVPWMLIALFYHLDDVSIMRWCIVVSMVTFYASFVSGICDHQKPSLVPFWNLLVRFPLMLGLGGFSMMNWCQCYSFARISDLTWGNREGAHNTTDGGVDDDNNVQVAIRQRAHLGKLFAFSLLGLNFVCYVGFSFWTIHDNRAVLYLIMIILSPSAFLMSLHGLASMIHGCQRVITRLFLLLILPFQSPAAKGKITPNDVRTIPSLSSAIQHHHAGHYPEDDDEILDPTDFMSMSSITTTSSSSLFSAPDRGQYSSLPVGL